MLSCLMFISYDNLQVTSAWEKVERVRVKLFKKTVGRYTFLYILCVHHAITIEYVICTQNLYFVQTDTTGTNTYSYFHKIQNA